MVSFPLLLRHLAKQPQESKSHAETGTPNHPLRMTRSPRTGEWGGHRSGPMSPEVDPNQPMRNPTVDRFGNQFTDTLGASVAIKPSTTSGANLSPPDITPSVLGFSNNQDGVTSRPTSERPSSTSFPGTSHSGSQIESSGSTYPIPSHSPMTATSSTNSPNAISNATLSDIASTTTNSIDKDALAKSSPNHNSLTMGLLGGVLGSLLILVAFFLSRHFWQRYKRRLEGLNNASEGAPPYTASASCVKEERPVGHEIGPSSATSLRELHDDELMVVRRSMPSSFLPNTVIYDEQTRHLYLPVQRNTSIRSTQATLGSVNVQQPNRDSSTVTDFGGYYSAQRSNLIRTGPTILRDPPLEELSEIDSDSLSSISPPSYQQ